METSPEVLPGELEHGVTSIDQQKTSMNSTVKATREPQSPAEVSSNLKIQQIHASIIIQGRYYDLRLIPPSVTPYNSLPLGGIAVGAPINQRMGVLLALCTRTVEFLG